MVISTDSVFFLLLFFDCRMESLRDSYTTGKQE